MNLRTPATLLSALVFVAGTSVSHAATLVATYNFNDSLLAEEASAPALLSVDPLLANIFETALVNGSSQRVFHWHGDGMDPANNAGLTLDATGLVAYDNYSLELTFEFLEAAQFDTQSRQSDNGFYVEPGNALQVYPVVTGSTIFTTSGFHSVVLSNFVVSGTREVKAYLDGNLELTSDTDELNLDNVDNPGHLLHFFLDNLAGPAQQEFADGRIALLKVYDGVLVPTPTVPEPAPAVLLLLGLAGLTAATRTRVA